MTVLRVAALIVGGFAVWFGLGALVVFILFGQPRRQQKGPDMNAFEKSLKWCDRLREEVAAARMPPESRKVMEAAIKKLHSSIVKDEKTILRYAEAGLDPIQAFTVTPGTLTSRPCVTALIAAGWIDVDRFGKTTVWRLRIGSDVST